MAENDQFELMLRVVQGVQSKDPDQMMAVIAELIEMNMQIYRELGDVPGDTTLAKVQRLKEWYQGLCNTFQVERRR